MYAPAGKGPSAVALLLTLPSLCIGLGEYSRVAFHRQHD